MESGSITAEPGTLPQAVAERLDALADDQRRAATAAPGPILCVAPAGSGKTTTVVARIAWRIATGTDPGSIRALTFNRRAAEELRERVDQAVAALDIGPGVVRVSTFHALGREILADAGLDVSRIAERAELIAALGLATDAPDAATRLDDAFSRLKLDPARGPPAEDITTHAAFAAYEAELERRGALDLDDLVARAGPTLRAEPKLLDAWQDRCAALFVDEAQDLDRCQLELATILTGSRRDIFLVGDDDQTIYGWRLADVRRILGLGQRLPGLVRVDLTTNHRCAPEVVRRAARLVARNRDRFDKRIEASPRASGEVRLAPDAGDEVARARRLLDAWLPYDEGTHAVLARTNRELAPLAALGCERGLTVAVEEPRLITGDDADRLVRAAAADASAGPTATVLLAVRDAAVRLRTPAEVVTAVLGWAAAARDGPSLVAAWERLLGSIEGAVEKPELTLATNHGTKGLEWEHVAVIGLDRDGFPSARSIDEADDPATALEEERRLAYVAYTRARRTLTLVYDPWTPSRFIEEAFDPVELPRYRRRHGTVTIAGAFVIPAT